MRVRNAGLFVGALGALLVSGLTSSAVVAGQELYSRNDILARAPLGIDRTHIGRFYDADFRSLAGGANTLLRSADDVRDVPVGYTRRDFRVVESEAELTANASLWGISASISAADVRKHAYFRAYELESLYQLDDSVPLPEVVPARAAYYISGIFVGRLFEAHFSSNGRRIGGRLAGGALVASGSIQGWARDQQLQVQIDTLGLHPTDSSALFASSQAEVRQHYTADGPTRAIFVRYTRIPDHLRATTVAEASRYRITIDRIRFPRRNPARQTAWDWGFGTAPEIMVRVAQNGSVLYEPTTVTRNSYERDFARERRDDNANAGVLGNVDLPAEGSLDFRFFDKDATAAGWDDAGTLAVTAVQIAHAEGSTAFNVGNGVTVWLTVTRIE